MASKLKVDEIRAELSLRGLETAGTKPFLVKRLEAAMRSEEKKTKDTGSEESSSAIAVPNVARKRKRGSDDAEPLAGEGLLSSDDRKEGDGVLVKSLMEYTVRELKVLAARRGVTAIGTKMELVERLSGIAETPKKNEEEEDPEEIKEEIMITATKKGGAVLDQWLPEDIKTNFQVLSQNLMMVGDSWFTLDGVELELEVKKNYMALTPHKKKQ